MHSAKIGWRHVLAAASLGIALVATPVIAQNAVFSGKVSSAGSPLGAASVGISSLGLGSVTDADGKYTFTVDMAKYAGRVVIVTARSIGYKPKTMSVTLVPGRVTKDFDLARDVLNLDQIVVTGTSAATSQKMAPFTVAAVDAAAIKEAPGLSPIASLSGKIAGASVVTTSGQPGSAPSIRLRSATSITGSSDPLIIVDGTITRQTLADISSEDIERVEIIKGAAASSLYGSDAANGVVQIFTKRGKQLAEGQTYFTFRSEFGRQNLPRTVPGNLSHPYVTSATSADGFERNASGNRVIQPSHISDQPYKKTYDYLAETFHPGALITNYLAIGQRKGATNFSASFQNARESGVLNLLTGYSRQNFRVNVDQQVSDKIDASVGAFYGRSNADQPSDPNNNIFFGLRFIEPNINIRANNADGSPFIANIKQPPQSGNLVNPLYVLANRQIGNSRDRFSGNGRVRYRPYTWLTAEGNFNYDVGNQNYKSFTPFGFSSSAGAIGKGSLFQQGLSNRSYNTGFTLTAVNSWKWLNNTTKAAYVYEDQLNNSLQVNATALTVGRVPEFAAASPDPSTPIQPNSRTEAIRAKNAFLVSTFEIKDRYIIDGVIRKDESSLFGAKARSQTYYRYSGAYRLSEDFHIPGVNELKLHASVGTAGLRPIFEAQYQTLDIVAGSPQKVRQGNPNLKPAFSKETEIGFNLNFLTNFTLEYAYSKKVTSDQILDVPLSSAAGYGSQWQNAGTLEGYTHELAIGALLLAKQNYTWKVNITGDQTRSKITALGVQPFLTGPDGNTALFKMAAGETFGVMYGDRWIRTPEQLAATIALAKIKGVATDYVKNEEGYYVLATAKGGLAERPLKAWSTDAKGAPQSVAKIGDVTPDLNMGINNSITYKNVSIGALVNVVRGGNIYNLTRQWPFNELRDPVFDQRGKAAGTAKPVEYYQVFYNGINSNEYFVEDGSYVRLRELSVNIQLPKSFAKSLHLGDLETARLGLVGRNLWTSTKYSGYDPDVTGGGGRPFTFRVDNFSYPATRTFTLMLELGY
jgi:TonB-linked SusC/RagA family outer membrane protein